jgi:hypothetical protein
VGLGHRRVGRHGRELLREAEVEHFHPLCRGAP